MSGVAVGVSRARTMGDGTPYCAPRARVRWENGIEIREIPEYPDYWAGEDGSIWSSKPRRGSDWNQILPYTTKSGYLRTNIWSDGRLIRVMAHRLVLLAFSGPLVDGMECLHGPDSTRSNVRASNLRWGTKSENIKEKFSSGRNSLKGEKHPQSRFKDIDIKKIREMYKSGKFTQKEIGEIYGVSKYCIGDITNRRSWSHVA